MLSSEITVIDSIHKYFIRRGGIINMILNLIFVDITFELHSFFGTIATLQSSIPHIFRICVEKVVQRISRFRNVVFVYDTFSFYGFRQLGCYI